MESGRGFVEVKQVQMKLPAQPGWRLMLGKLCLLTAISYLFILFSVVVLPVRSRIFIKSKCWLQCSIDQDKQPKEPNNSNKLKPNG